MSVCMLLILCLVVGVLSKAELPRIGIIGAGIGGVSTAHFLREEFGASALIDVYERETVGGRLKNVELGGREYEAGGSIIHPRNQYMRNFTELLGLSERDKSHGRFSIYDGSSLVFDGSSWSPLLIFQLLWRYGTSAYKLPTYIQDMLKDFDRLYEVQHKGHAYTTPDRLLYSATPHFVELLETPFHLDLQKRGFSEKFVKELASGGLRGNYGQGPFKLHAFVGGVSMAAAESGLWSVHGGNQLIPQYLLKRSSAKLVKAQVQKVIYNAAEGNYEVVTTSGKSVKYDIVVLAAPLGEADLTIEGIPAVKQWADSIPMHRTTATFVRGLPDAAKFGYRTTYQLPEEIFTTDDVSAFNSLGKLAPVDFNAASAEEKQISPVWKVFSQAPLSDEEIKNIFVSAEEVKVVDWRAYPGYSASQDRTKIPPFELHAGLYYTSPIEMCASAMEMMAISGRNIALLAHHRWTGDSQLVDTPLDEDQNREKIEL